MKKYKEKTNWNELPIRIWRVVLYKDNDRGQQKFYEFDGDHGWIAEGFDDIHRELDGVKNKDLIEIKKSEK